MTPMDPVAFAFLAVPLVYIEDPRQETKQY